MLDGKQLLLILMCEARDKYVRAEGGPEEYGPEDCIFHYAIPRSRPMFG